VNNDAVVAGCTNINSRSLMSAPPGAHQTAAASPARGGLAPAECVHPHGARRHSRRTLHRLTLHRPAPLFGGVPARACFTFSTCARAAAALRGFPVLVFSDQLPNDFDIRLCFESSGPAFTRAPLRSSCEIRS